MRRLCSFLLPLLALLIAGCNAKSADAPKKANNPPESPQKTKTGVTPPKPGPGPNKLVVKGPQKPTPAPAPTLKGRKLAFSLATNIHLAHLWRDKALFIPTDSASFFKYVHGRWKANWKTGVSLDQVRVALLRGKQAIIRFPWASTGGATFQFRFKSAGTKQRVSIFVNEKELPAISIGSGWQTVVVKFKPGLLKRGENKIRFYFRSSGTISGLRTAGAVRYLMLDPTSKKRKPLLRNPSPVDTVDGKPHLTNYSGFDFYLAIPEGAVLHCPAVVSKGASTLQALVTLDGAPEQAVFTHKRSAGVHLQSANLARHGGKVVRLRLLSSGPGDVSWGPNCGLYVEAKKPRFTSLPKPKHVFIWMVDTLRADRLKVYNPKSRVKTPNFDAFIKSAITFSHASVQGSHSIPSHASILTGLYPGKHGMYNDKGKHNASSILISEVFKKAGFTTAAFLSNGYVSASWGYKQGWSYYKNFIRDKEPSHSKYVMPRLFKWLGKNKNKRLFMYIATIDPHVAYRFRKEYTTQYDSKEPYRGKLLKYCTGHHLERIKSGRMKLSDRDKIRMKALYDGEVSFNDYYFGQFIARLKKLGLYDESVIVIISDHGDEFWEHGSVGHGHSLHRELIDIPFVIRIPGAPKNLLVEDGAEGLDLFPTLTHLAGLTTPEVLQGRELVSLMRRQSPRIISPTFASRARIERAMTLGRWKYIVRDPDTDFLYDRNADPNESKNVRQQYPIAYRYARDVISFYLAYEKRWRKAVWGTPNNVTATFVKETRF